jgi:hypothetical protein
MTYTYLKKIFPMTWRKSYTPPIQYEISFDTSSQYITNTVTPFYVWDDADAIYYSASPNTVSVWWTNVTMQLADEWTAITWWSMESEWVTETLPAWTYALIWADTEFIPTVTHTVIHRDTQWPCPNGFHIGTKDEWQALVDALTTLWAYNVSNIKTYLKIPDAYYLARSNGTKETRYWTVRMWMSTMTANNVAWAWWIDENNLFVFQADKPGNGFSIRPFKDNPVAPDNTWTLITTWIYWSSTLWLISIQNGNGWITISDKNLWATNVLDNWLFYQFWNNTWYTYNATPYVTSKPTLSDNYWPGNYYTGSFVRVSSGNNWFNWTDNNIWWWVTNGTWTDPV